MSLSSKSPKAPMNIIPAKTKSDLKEFLASMIRYPKPDWAPTISPATRNTQADPKANEKRYKPAICGLKASFLQMTLQFVFLPYNAWLMVHAAVLSLVRVLFTKRNMLEWVTALDAERGLKNSLKGYVIKMKAAAFQALVVVVLAFAFKTGFSAAVSVLPFAVWFHRLL